MSRLSFTITVFWLTAIMITAVTLRNAHDRNFYELWSCRRTERILKQQLWQKQLELESITNPAAVSCKLNPAYHEQTIAKAHSNRP